MTLGKRLKNLRKLKGYSQDQVAQALDYKSFTTIQKWESDDAAPPVQILERLANLYGCQISDFFSESRLKRVVPIMGTVIGGSPLEAIEEYLGEHEVFMEPDGHEYFYLRVKGESMIEARIYPGDEVFVRKQTMVDNGDIAIVLIGAEATIKRVYIKNNKLILKPENANYEAMEYELSQLNQENIMILGKVLHNRVTIK